MPSRTALEVVVGVDVHKARHTLVGLDRDGLEVVVEEVATHRAALAALAGQLQQVAAAHAGRLAVVLEDAQGYGLGLAGQLLAGGLMVYQLPPTLVAQRRRRTTVYADKSDWADARLIAQVARLEPHHPRLVRLPSGGLQALTQLDRVRQHLVREQTATRNLLHQELHQVYPSYRALFRDPFSQAARRFWIRFPTPAQLQAVTRRTVARVLGPGHGGRGLSYAAVERCWLQLRDLRQQPPPAAGAAAHVIPLLLRCLAELERERVALEAALPALLPLEGNLLTTLTGVQTVTAAQLLVELRQPERFDNANALARYAEVAPRPWHSAGRGRYRASHRGNRRLHGLLYRLALSQAKDDPIGQAYYRRKLAEGKTKHHALVCLMRQLCRVIFALLRQRRACQASPPRSAPASAT